MWRPDDQASASNVTNKSSYQQTDEQRAKHSASLKARWAERRNAA